jgi:hypothetical protein
VRLDPVYPPDLPPDEVYDPDEFEGDDRIIRCGPMEPWEGEADEKETEDWIQIAAQGK